MTSDLGHPCMKPRLQFEVLCPQETRLNLVQPECHSLVEVQTPPPRFPSIPLARFLPLQLPSPVGSPTQVQQQVLSYWIFSLAKQLLSQLKKEGRASASLEGGRHKVETAGEPGNAAPSTPRVAEEQKAGPQGQQVESSLSYNSPFRPEVGGKPEFREACVQPQSLWCNGTHHQPTTDRCSMNGFHRHGLEQNSQTHEDKYFCPFM